MTTPSRDPDANPRSTRRRSRSRSRSMTRITRPTSRSRSARVRGVPHHAPHPGPPVPRRGDGSLSTRNLLLLFVPIAAALGVRSAALAGGAVPRATALSLGAVAHPAGCDGDFTYYPSSRRVSLVDDAGPTSPRLASSAPVGGILALAVKGGPPFLGGPSVDLRVV